jgi:hypothetical protein
MKTIKAAALICSHVQSIPLGQPFSAAAFNVLAANDNVRQILCRLIKRGKLARIARGIFVRPKEVAYVGAVLPTAELVAKTIAQTSGETIAPHGAEAARILQLSTQVPMQRIFYTSGNSRCIKLGGEDGGGGSGEIVFKHVSARKLACAGTITGLVISALWYLGKENVNNSVIEKVKQRLSPEQFSALYEHLSNMPIWMANVFYHYRQQTTQGGGAHE